MSTYSVERKTGIFSLKWGVWISFFGEKEIWLSRHNLGDIVTLGLKSDLFTYEIIYLVNKEDFFLILSLYVSQK